MKLCYLIRIQDALSQAADFVSSNSDSDKSGLGLEMVNEFSELRTIIQKEKHRIYFRNAKARLKKSKS
jgi:hypothetical protein